MSQISVDSTELSLENDDEMILALRALPNISVVKLWASEQKKWREYRNQEWNFIASWIKCRLMHDNGFKSSLDFYENMDLELITLLLIKGNIYYAFFQLIIEVFDKIEQSAFKRGRKFPFTNARQLFSEILKELADSEFDDVCSPKVNQGPSLTESRRGFKSYCSFWRGSIKEEKLTKYLEYLSSSLYWCDFCPYILWKYHQANEPRLSDKFKFLWHEHLKALNNFDNFISQPFTDKDYRIIVARWSAGYPHDPKSGQRLLLSS